MERKTNEKIEEIMLKTIELTLLIAGFLVMTLSVSGNIFADELVHKFKSPSIQFCGTVIRSMKFSNADRNFAFLKKNF